MHSTERSARDANCKWSPATPFEQARKPWADETTRIVSQPQGDVAVRADRFTWRRQVLDGSQQRETTMLVEIRSRQIRVHAESRSGVPTLRDDERHQKRSRPHRDHEIACPPNDRAPRSAMPPDKCPQRPHGQHPSQRVLDRQLSSSRIRISLRSTPALH